MLTAITGNNIICRPAVSICDISELCTGQSADCPIDLLRPNGFSCSDGVFCNGAEFCLSGVCTNGSVPVCDDQNACTTVDFCDPNLDKCVNIFNPLIGTPCYTGPNDTAGIGSCKEGQFQCIPNGNLICVNEIVPNLQGDICGGDACVLDPSSIVDDGNICNGLEKCEEEELVIDPGPLDCNPTQDTCRNGTCHPTLGCQFVFEPDNTTCDIPDINCSEQEVCVNGTCTCLGDIEAFPRGVIIAIAVGIGLLLLLSLCCCLFYATRRRRRRRNILDRKDEEPLLPTTVNESIETSVVNPRVRLRVAAKGPFTPSSMDKETELSNPRSKFE